MKRLVSALLLLSAASFFAADSIQLLSDPGMKTASGWKAFGKNAVRKNTRTLVLSKPAGAERERCAWRANTVIPGKQLSGPFILTFESETNGITPARADDAWAGAVAPDDSNVLLHSSKFSSTASYPNPSVACATAPLVWGALGIKGNSQSFPQRQSRPY